MVQSNVIVTYAPARRTAAVAPAREAGRRGSRRVGVTLAGALLAGGAAFMLGTYVRPDGTIREPGTALPQQTGPSATVRERGAPSAQPEPIAAGAAEAREAEAEPLPFLALVRDAAPTPSAAPSAVAARPLAAPAAREEISGTGRGAMRADRRPPPPAPTPALAPAPGRADDVLAIDAGIAPPPVPAPEPGLRRDLEGFLGQQGLVLATETQSDGAIAPVSEWTADDLPVLDSAPSALAAVAIEPAPAPGNAGAPGADPVAEPVALGVTTEAADDLPTAEAVFPVAPIATTSPANTRLVSADALAAANSEAVERAVEPVSRIAAVAVAPIPAGPSAAVLADPVYVQSFPLAVVNGEPLGAITLRDLGAQGIAVHLGALVELLKLRMPEEEFARLSTAAAADRFVTLEELREAGIAVRLDESWDRLFIEAR